jgi:hypothetical protein
LQKEVIELNNKGENEVKAVKAVIANAQDDGLSEREIDQALEQAIAVLDPKEYKKLELQNLAYLVLLAALTITLLVLGILIVNELLGMLTNNTQNVFEYILTDKKILPFSILFVSHRIFIAYFRVYLIKFGETKRLRNEYLKQK